jgi:hypothetical protein
MPRVRTQNDDGSKANIEYVSTSAGAADADKFVRTSANGKLDPSVLDLSGAGLAQTNNVEVAISAGQAVSKRFVGGNNRLILANATDLNAPCIGFATATQTTVGGTLTWVPLVGEIATTQAGIFNADYFLGLTDGAIVTSVATYVVGNGVQKVGWCSGDGILNGISEDIEAIA